ncbi:hypothetical protein E2P42_02390 [Candidatus Bathyarchaeota archaeon]|nr:hypothetical protein E2P42_02390 [Candidatus Bathyarchaeota archaeon]
MEQYPAPKMLTAGQIMTSPFINMNVEVSVEEAATCMAMNRVKTLLVMNGEKLVEAVLFTDIAF